MIPPVVRRPRLLIGAGLLVLAVLLGLVIVLLGDGPLPVDRAWNSLLLATPSPFLAGLSGALNIAGGTLVGSLVVPTVGVALLLVVRRPWSAAAFVIAIAASALVVQILKHLFARGRPEEILVISDFGSYPSGHVANAATVAAMLVLLLPRVWTLVVGAGWVVIMAFSRTYLHAHWLSDTVGGALAGVGVALVTAALLAARLAPETGPWRGRSASPGSR